MNRKKWGRVRERKKGMRRRTHPKQLHISRNAFSCKSSLSVQTLLIIGYWITSACCDQLAPSTPAVPICCCSKGLAPYWSNPPFLIFDIRACWRSGLSASAPQFQKLKMVKCKALAGSVVKGLKFKWIARWFRPTVSGRRRPILTSQCRCRSDTSSSVVWCF